MNYAGVCTSVKIFVLCVFACVIERERGGGGKSTCMCENETFKCKYEHVRVHNSALLLHTTYQTPTPCGYLGEYQATKNLM